ncbi:MAG TPA: hypothetical protein VF503_17110 [Sphingobium sp.]|uniref:hypothetical protein n=1 Tax=Sphingobium sp. TaxID=1912891 RepID=UPI002ED1272E
MPGAVAPLAQSLFVLTLPIVLVLAPSQGAVRTVTLGRASAAAIVNAAINVDGRIVSMNADGGLVLAGRRDRIIRALLPLGVLALPAPADGCSYVGGR